MSVWLYALGPSFEGWIVLMDENHSYWHDEMKPSASYLIKRKKAKGRVGEFFYIGEFD